MLKYILLLLLIKEVKIRTDALQIVFQLICVNKSLLKGVINILLIT